MATGKAVVLDKPNGTFRIEEYGVPQLEPGTVLLRQELAGCCATDAHTYLGQWEADFPVIMGHENVGMVEALGPGGAVDFVGRELRVGDRVIARTTYCGACYECRAARNPRNCLNRKVRYGFGNAQRAPFSGGYGEYLYLSSPQTTFMLKINAPPSVAVLHEPLGVAAHAVRKSQPQLGSTVVVQGSGAIGLFTLGLARLAGATRAIVVGGPADRLELAQAFGADVVINIDDVRTPEARLKAVLDETPGRLGADVVYGCVGKAAAWSEGIDYLRNGDGRFLEVGLAGDDGEVPFNPATQLVSKNASFIGALGMTDEDSLAAVRVLEAKQLPLEEMVSHQLPLDRVADAIDALNGDYRLDGRTAFKIAVAPNGTMS
jgi:threonine dehydrogenase-like Zn-dependent dehydrogenase